MTRGKWLKIMTRLVEQTGALVAEVSARAASETPTDAGGNPDHAADIERTQTLQRRWEENQRAFHAHVELGKTLGYGDPNV